MTSRPHASASRSSGPSCVAPRAEDDTHTSTTDPDARWYRTSNGAESRLAYLGRLLIENRHGLIADAMATIGDGFAEREAATRLVHA